MGKHRPIGLVKRLCKNLIKLMDAGLTNQMEYYQGIYLMQFRSAPSQFLFIHFFGFCLKWYTLFFTCVSFLISTTLVLTKCYTFPCDSFSISLLILLCSISYLIFLSLLQFYNHSHFFVKPEYTLKMYLCDTWWDRLMRSTPSAMWCHDIFNL